jgi:hypothetical protein
MIDEFPDYSVHDGFHCLSKNFWMLEVLAGNFDLFDHATGVRKVLSCDKFFHRKKIERCGLINLEIFTISMNAIAKSVHTFIKHRNKLMQGNVHEDLIDLRPIFNGAPTVPGAKADNGACERRHRGRNLGSLRQSAILHVGECGHCEANSCA